MRSTAQQGAPEPKPSKDGEARFMFKRAQELAKNRQADQAIAMLNTSRQSLQGNADGE